MLPSQDDGAREIENGASHKRPGFGTIIVGRIVWRSGAAMVAGALRGMLSIEANLDRFAPTISDIVGHLQTLRRTEPRRWTRFHRRIVHA